MSKQYSDAENDVTGVRTWLILWRASRAIELNALESIAGTGLGLSDFAVLEMLLHKGAQPVNFLGKKILLASGSITAAIDRLEERHLVKRTVGSEDRRSRIVQLTDAGRRLIEAAFKRHAEDLEETMAALNQSERKELVRLLKKVGLWAQSRLDNQPASRLSTRNHR